MKIEDLDNDFSILHYQPPEGRVKQVKAILKTFSLVVLLLMLNSAFFHNSQDIFAYAAVFLVLVTLCSFVTSDTTSIVAGMFLWTILLFACYMAWKNDGLYDTSIVAFPCILIFSFMLGGVSLLVPLASFMILSFYFLAYASDQGILIKSSLVEGPLWIKANNLTIILLVYSLSIFVIYRYFNVLMNRLKDEANKKKKFKEEAETRLQRDILTGLPNEFVCQEDLQEWVEKGEIKDEILGVASLDLKNFEWVDSSLGHDIGDQVICQLSERLTTMMDEKKKLYRVTSNEFMILVLAQDYEIIADFCHQVLQVVYRPFQIDNYDIEISAGIGIATAPFDGTDYPTLRQKSHTALYKAKFDEEEHLQFFESEMEHSITRRMNMVRELKKAIVANEFELYYQPKIDLSTGEIIGAEALIRWCKSTGECISPAEFIPAAEESGLINEIGKWTLEQACIDCRSWHEKAWPLSIAVNLSPVQFKRGNLVKVVGRALKKSGMDPSYLELEITESMFIGDAERTKTQIYQLVNQGINIAIDDFGTGYSNLNYLAKFNASTLKIDMSFVRKMMSSTQHLHIVDAVIRMAEAMELECVAEGVEDENVAEKLRQLGCHYGQGFLWSKPLPKDKFQALLESKN